MDFSNSSLSSAVSIGTAEMRPLSPHKPVVTNITGPAMISQSAELFPSHRLPSPPMLRDSPLLSPVSQDTMHHLQCPPDPKKRKSIIDPGSVQFSFMGSITDISYPLAMPLEAGFQKLYKLYEQSKPTSAPLPHEVQITAIPLETIADHLETYIKEQNDALQDCALNVQKLNLTNDRAKQDLISLEFKYCLARQQANMRAMTSDDIGLRLEWMRDEIARVNVEKEKALQENLDHKKEYGRLQKELENMLDTIQENQELKQINFIHEQKQRELQQELEVVKRKLDEAQFALRAVPSPFQKLCVRMLVPQRGKVREKKKMLIPEDTEAQEKETIRPTSEIQLPQPQYC